MPLYLLQAKAELEGIESLTPKESIAWKLDVQNEASERREGITVCAVDEEELEGSRGTANFVVRFSKGDQQAYIKLERLVKKTHGDGVLTVSGQWTTLAVLECRGLEPTKAHPGNDFDIKSSGERVKVFADADFSQEPDFCDYDEDNDLSVSVTGLEYRIVRG